MAENITSLYDIYNRPNDAGKATDIQSDDLFLMQRGTGSNQNKCIKGSDVLKSSGLVVVNSNDMEPRTLYEKLNDSGTIGFMEDENNGHLRVKAFLFENCVETRHLVDALVTTAKLGSSSVTTAKIAEGAVTESKIALNSIQEQAIKDGAVTTSKLGDGSVSTAKLQNASVSGAKLGASLINSQYSVNLLIGTDIDQSTNTFASKIHTFSAVDYGGIIDVSVYARGVNITYMDNVKFQIRKTGSSTAETEWDVDKLIVTELSRRLLVKNGVNSPATYELWVIGDVTSAMPTGLSGFLACEVELRGISMA